MKPKTRLGFPVDVIGHDGNRIACQVAGPADAPPVLLTSGIGCGPVFYRDIAPELARSYRVVFWDFRAHGDSELAPDERSYRVIDHARDMDSVVTQLNSRPPLMISFSMGVQVTMEWIKHFEGEDGRSIPGYVFLLGTPRNPLRRHWFWGNEKMRQTVDRTLDHGGDAVVKRLHPVSKAVLRNRLSYAIAHRIGLVSRAFSYRDYLEFIRYSTGVRPDAYLRTATGLLEHDALDTWAKLDVPTLYIAAEKDFIVPARECRDVVPLHTAVHYAEIGGRSHAGTVESGQELAHAVREFVDARFSEWRSTASDGESDASRKSAGGRPRRTAQTAA